jgi:hypothetical protein
MVPLEMVNFIKLYFLPKLYYATFKKKRKKVPIPTCEAAMED